MRKRGDMDMATDHALAVIHAVLEGRDFSVFNPRDAICTSGWHAWSWRAASGEW